MYIERQSTVSKLSAMCVRITSFLCYMDVNDLLRYCNSTLNIHHAFSVLQGCQ